ncbi:membrane cofactor protein-like isoform X2 [Notolabrus celidotus]|uniref:membrane cofactor protein-like isoform X2 n=1 Tax=Notolabrus celidotus TaxID=1203425 RepID=UPI00148FF225|nr:membrane cofactor protein-like isoform X2 [Notolabrus celidotus]
MKNTEGIFLLLSYFLLASAQEPKTCSTPGAYPHTRLDPRYSSRLKFSHKEKVYYRCEEDFSPSRGVHIVQCVDGTWTKLTLKCDKRSCGNAGDLPNGIFVYEESAFIGEKVYAVCNKGYTLKGLNYMICKRSGWTGEIPTCEEGEPSCSSPAVENSVGNNGSVSMYQLGESLNFTCSPGFQLDGAQKITCGPGGQWQPAPPRCLPSPEETQLPDKEGGCDVPKVSSSSNAHLADNYITVRSFSSGDKVSYKCDVGYIPAGGSRYRSCSKGKWSPLRLICEPQLCGSAGEIPNGEFKYTGVEFGDTATAICDEGYNLVGRADRHCMSGGWDGRVPVCEAMTCEAPPPVGNAYMIGEIEQTYEYRRVIRFQCRAGALIGKREIWCTEKGTWSDPPPKCKEITCPRIRVPNASWTRAIQAKYLPRDTLYIECNHGYTQRGPKSVTCGAGGRWYPSPPHCELRLHPKFHRG